MFETARRPDCPICQATGHGPLISFTFRRKAHLPDHVRLYACRDCDLAFSWPREPDSYERYYGEVANDFHTGVETFRNLKQTERLSDIIAVHGLRRILDYGCGGGGLVSGLAARHPDGEFVGYDVNGDFPTGLANLTFTQRLPKGPFDLIILSHVLEHAPDPVGLGDQIKSELQPLYLYVEVPDPQGYLSRAQPQYLYYIDRLHINHFTLKSLTRALGGGISLIQYGKYDMPYDIGPIYPSQYALFSMSKSDIERSMNDYIDEEARAALHIRARVKNNQFYIYGYGDNFFRNRSNAGPLSGLDDQILGVIDRSIEAMSSGLPTGWAAIRLEDLASINGQMIVCTVTQSRGLVALFAKHCPGSEVIYL